ncbi:MAG TPA: FAD-dependent monooxygenase [Actinophytocola sp.]|uniref:FAD-dependent oxidoreductase n=1 Tax=Actinophytocola sp. TaxID=1872138 RepID=UPI002DB801B1|nr:FAD-dependent monooxygenase [Actinophytocola sp.]HEU5475565.1 FAD-dependent monooxygenase [Actinophytocola sp.]
MSSTGTRAVVLGGSIAGLFAAKVLSEAYDEVLVVDRDVLLGADGPRRSCPQGKHINGLLARGQKAMEELYPGITEELFADGVPTGDLAGDVRWYFNGRRLKPQSAELVCVAASRPMLEKHIRNRTNAVENITFQQETDILGLETTPDRRRVTGIRVQGKADTAERVISADLVVDATGRGSRTPIWLEDLGYPRVEEERKKIGLGYVTQHYRLTKDPYHGDLSINPAASPEVPRGAIFTKTDGDRVELTVYGLLGDHPPTDQAGFYEFVKSLAIPDIHLALQHAEPLDEPVAFRFPTTLRRHYETMSRFPDGLLVTGDAVCCFNPIYAQGMSVAALGALTIRAHLHTGATPQPLQYFRDLATDAIDATWEMTNTVDLSFKGVEGNRTLKVRMGQKYLKLVQTAATRDGAVTAAYMRAAGLVESPESLMRPSMVLRVLRNAVRGPAANPPLLEPAPRETPKTTRNTRRKAA